MNAKHTDTNIHEVSAREKESVLEKRSEGKREREMKEEGITWQGECIQRKYLSMQRNGKFEVASIERRASTHLNIHIHRHTHMHRNTHAGIDEYVWQLEMEMKSETSVEQTKTTNKYNEEKKRKKEKQEKKEYE